MSATKKKIVRFLKSPKTSSYADLLTILVYFGFEKVQTRGSHVKFKHLYFSNDLVIPVHNNECKHFYKIEARKRILKLVNK